MEITTGLALILAFIAGFSYFSRRFMGDLYLERAIILGPVTGLIMGDLHTGLVIGGTLELIFMGAVDIGGSVPPNLPIGSTLGTAFAISAGLTTDEALLIAIPAALLGSFFELLAKTVSTVFVSGAERFADEGNASGVSAMVHLGNLAHFLAVAIPTFLALQLGSDAVDSLSSAIPDTVQSGIRTAGSVLPALGFGILLSMLAAPNLLPWFFLGFALAAYAQFGVLGTAFVGIMAATIYVIQTGGVKIVRQAAEAETAVESHVPRSEQRRIFWRSFALQSAFSFDRMQALGFTWTLMPFLRKLYGNTEEFGKALRRHLAFFNTHMWIPGPIFAMVADLEARRAENPEEVDVSSIQAVKGSLMGPLAGIGDSMFHGTLRPLAGGIAASLALEGNPIAPLFFFFSTNIVHVWVQWVSQNQGFRLGSRLFEQMDQEGLQRLMRGATIAGLMGVGGLVGTWLSITTPLTYTAQEAAVSIQVMLDSIMPKLLPLLTTLGVYWAIRRGYRTVSVMLILALGAFVLGLLGILG
jgi:mannose/fructose/N-acetylgalactosamine-specific phosphotransferase system component IID